MTELKQLRAENMVMREAIRSLEGDSLVSKRNKIKLQTGGGPNLVVELVGGCSPYIWIGNDENYGYLSDRSVKKLMRFCKTCIKPKKRCPK